jgi:nitroimidazol reductase NimA-like FMN-containing flavoprotein (pyridoxamine 5'-phosphate oxidase superfamily)
MPDRSAASPTPRVDQPEIPAEYGVSKTTARVDWSHVEERLSAARVYWIVTVGAGGRPRARPVDGMYVEGALYVGGSPKARWVQELAANPHVSIHLDGVDDVVIVDGDAEILPGAGDELANRLAAASKAKYPEYGMTAENFTGPGPIAITPRKIIAWTDFTKNPTRFTPG